MFAAKLIYDGLKNEQDLNVFIGQQVENLYVDFKTKSDHQSNEVDRDLQVNLSKGISGFANSDGGVLVIGVDARVDRPATVKSIAPIAEFEQNINTYLPRATSFLVQGTEVKSILLDAGGGVVLVYVPKSELAPHCSMKDKKYYQRNGDSFVAMEHFQVADAFGRRHHPVLLPYASLQGDLNTAGKITVTLGVDNRGRAVARYPYFKLTDLAGFEVNQFGISGNGQFGLPRLPSLANSKSYRGGADDVVHPGAPLDITRLHRRFTLGEQGQLSENFQNLMFEGEIVADQFSLKSWQIKVSRQQIQDSIVGRLQSRVIRVDGELL